MPHLTKYRKIIIIFFAVVTCIVFSSGVIRHDVKEQEYLDLGSQPQFGCVGQVFRDGKAQGSSVLISSRYVLSAAHVFMISDHRPDTMEYNGQTIILNRSFNTRKGDAAQFFFSFDGVMYQAESITLYPAYMDSTTKGNGDIALIRLKEEVKTVVPAALNSGFNELHMNVTGVGFGASGIANAPETVESYGKKIGGQNVIDSTGGFKLSGNPSLLFCDFDHPEDKTCNKMGDAIPRPLEYIVAGGDSGGGLFIETTDGWRLAGIASGAPIDLAQLKKTGYYGQIMEWTRVSVFADWIKQNIH